MTGDRKSLTIAKNHPMTSPKFSAQFGPSIHKRKGFKVRIQPKKFTRTSPKAWEDNFLGIPFLAPKWWVMVFQCAKPSNEGVATLAVCCLVPMVAWLCTCMSKPCDSVSSLTPLKQQSPETLKVTQKGLESHVPSPTKTLHTWKIV